MTSHQIRKHFLDFFRSKNHEIVASAPVVVKDDPTLLFNNSGMAQFKDIFLGTKSIQYPRVADTQKCMRVSGKHNDLEDVGHDTYHHTLFEMLGNWSFGDYYKKEAIEWAWELLTKEFGIPKDRLYVTVFGGDEKDNMPADQEAYQYWKSWTTEDRILYGSKKDNFWEMGEVGPCGPCSEIHVDCRPDSEREKIPGRDLVNNDHPQVIEIWNNVFMQFQRNADGSLTDLPAKHVDTGMGFERLCMVLQGKLSTYDTDVFLPSRLFLEEKTGKNYETATHMEQVAFRVIMDHIRSVTFPIADGQIPSNTGAGYVVRRILRRASRYAYQYLGLNTPFMYEMVAVLAAQFSDIFPEINAQKDFIRNILEQEEKSFLRKLEAGSRLFEEYFSQNPDATVVDGDFAFKLYDTFGFPIDLTQLMARERGGSVDMEGFEQNLKEQKARSRKAGEVKTGDWVEVCPSGDLPKFLGYDETVISTRILRYRTLQAQKGNIYQVVLEETPFYAEGGGQIGDRGTISNGNETLEVLDTKRENETIVHFTDKLPVDADGEWVATVSSEHRRLVRANHSATHLLHAALRKVLGTHVEQRGSLVTPELLRFDFSHFAKMTDEEIQKTEDIVNAKIAEGIALTEYRSVPKEDAQKMGAMALFGEKYGDSVRVIVFDPAYSVELCGGIHVKNTSEIRLFKLTSESSIAAGIRRVECVTADGAFQYLNGALESLRKISGILKSPKDLEKSVEELLAKNAGLEKQIAAFGAEKVQSLKYSLKEKAKTVSGVSVISEVVSLNSAADLKDLSFELKGSTQNTLIVLGCVISDKPQLSVIMSDDLAESGKFNAGNIVRELAKEIQGGGGGQAFYATAGGKDAGGLKKAVDKVLSLIA
ncbi:MAG: alanine--tRNA ligase [Bacteroidia bacterium]|nr:alanine--tRNA ligase [Bacteroidia bacterium]